MAISIGNVTSKTGNLSQSGATFSHNNDGDYLLVGVLQGFSDSAAVPTAVAYNGVAMTKIGEVAYGSSHGISVWELIAPAGGANNVTLTYTGQNIQNIVAVSMSGVHQTTPKGTVVTASAASTTPSVVATSASGEVVVDFVASRQQNAATATVGAGQTQLFNTATATGLPNLDTRGLVSWEAGAASVTMAWTLSASESWKQVAVPVKPAAGGGGGTDTILPILAGRANGGFFN